MVPEGRVQKGGTGLHYLLLAAVAPLPNLMNMCANNAPGGEVGETKRPFKKLPSHPRVSVSAVSEGGGDNFFEGGGEECRFGEWCSAAILGGGLAGGCDFTQFLSAASSASSPDVLLTCCCILSVIFITDNKEARRG